MFLKSICFNIDITIFNINILDKADYEPACNKFFLVGTN